MSERETAYALGQFLGHLAPLAIGVGVSFHLRKKREQDHLPGWPIVIGLILTILSCTATPAARTIAPVSGGVSKWGQ